MSRAHDRAIADIFFALGDGTRLSVIAKLRAEGALSATALSDGATVTRQAIVKHLQVLEGAGLVTHERHGHEVLYAFDIRRLNEARAFLEAMSAGWDRAIERLRGIVEGPRRARCFLERKGASPRLPRWLLVPCLFLTLMFGARWGGSFTWSAGRATGLQRACDASTAAR